MIEVILVYIAMAIAIGYTALKQDGFKFIAYDRDSDGIVQEGTKWERSHFFWNKHPRS